MEKREEIVARLTDFYEQNGIVPEEERFKCENRKCCNNKGILLSHGMQCHIGSKYGEEGRIKVLVVSLDCGDDGKANINERTQDVEKGDNNPHMKGTRKLVSDILQFENDIESLRYYIMTNSCKCTRKEGTNQLPDFFYEQCSNLKKQEIEIIDPDVVYFQGQRSLIGMNFESIDNQRTGIFEYLKFLKFEDKKFFAVQCIHPSARGRSYSKKRNFYDNLLPEINKYLREQINKGK